MYLWTSIEINLHISGPLYATSYSQTTAGGEAGAGAASAALIANADYALFRIHANGPS